MKYLQEKILSIVMIGKDNSWKLVPNLVVKDGPQVINGHSIPKASFVIMMRAYLGNLDMIVSFYLSLVRLALVFMLDCNTV